MMNRYHAVHLIAIKNKYIKNGGGDDLNQKCRIIWAIHITCMQFRSFDRGPEARRIYNFVFCNGVGDWLNYKEKRRGMLLMMMMVRAKAIGASISLSPHWLRDYQIFMNPQYVKEMNPYSQKFPILPLSPFYLSISLLYLYVAYPTKSCWMSMGDSCFIHVMNMPYSWL